MANKYIYSGGLGDIMYQLHVANTYHAYEKGDEIVVNSPNPKAPLLWAWHPMITSGKVKCTTLETFDPALISGCSRPTGERYCYDLLNFYLSPNDYDMLNSADVADKILFAPFAGDSFKDFPREIIDLLLNCSGTNDFFQIISQYRDHKEQILADTYISGITPQGTYELIKQSAAVITAHSAVNMMAWFLRKPILLLYPPLIKERHIDKCLAGTQNPDDYGLNLPTTTHCLLQDFNEAVLSSWLSKWQ